MPTYTFRDKNTGKTFNVSMKIAEREQFLKHNDNLEQVITEVAFGDPVRLGVRKTDDNFNSMLKYINKRNPGSVNNTR